MGSIRRRGRNYSFSFTDANGRRIEKKGCSDKRATEEMLRAAETAAAKMRAGLIDPKVESFKAQDNRPLVEHLEDWKAAMLDKGRTAKHADLSFNRTLAIATATKAGRLSDLQPSRIQGALAKLRDSGRSLQTCNHHRACIRAFARWAKADGRMQHDPMAGVSGYNAREDIRHGRRDLMSDDLARLIGAAQMGTPIYRMSGPDRAMAYRIAFGTGFRVNELRSLVPASFRLNGDRPVVVLKASNAKDRCKVEQPISTALAADIRSWLAEKPAGRPVLPLHHETAKMIRRDLEAAGIAYQTEEGIADFHSLRTSFCSALINTGADIKTFQTLSRHKEATTTLAHYAKANPTNLVGAVQLLPNPKGGPQGAAEGGARAANELISDLLATHLPRAGGGIGRLVAATKTMTNSECQAGEKEKPPELVSWETVRRLVAGSDVNKAERGGFEPPIGFDTYNGLANRRFRPLSHLSSGKPAVFIRRLSMMRTNLPNRGMNVNQCLEAGRDKDDSVGPQRGERFEEGRTERSVGSEPVCRLVLIV